MANNKKTEKRITLNVDQKALIDGLPGEFDRTLVELNKLRDAAMLWGAAAMADKLGYLSRAMTSAKDRINWEFAGGKEKATLETKREQEAVDRRMNRQSKK